ncbi:MAG: hypothetical protein EB078_09575, partial [Proteobacteria bacterium]|nr:hypothetical protein [Pseudomonadota bacterium]NDD05146.1 hypothetical protein [Pseudomonadota bacterium]
IYGVNTVIDSGLERQASFSWWTGIPALKTRSVSKASAIQRAGRAARTGPGACYRLFTKADFESRPSYTLPEIFRADLSQVVLELKSLGVQDLSTFAWFEAPSKDSLVAAEEVLYLLGALSPRGGPLTEMGSRMSQIPTPPRISRLLIEAEALSCLESALYLSAMLTEGVLDQLDAMECLTKKPSFLVSRSLKQLERYFPLKSSYKDDPQQLSKAVLRGFPDRVAKRKEMSLNARQRSHQVEFLFCAGGTAEAPETAFTLANDFFVALSVQETGQAARGLSKTVARSFLPIEDADLMDLNPSLLSERQELSWDKTKRKVSSVSLLSYGQIVLEERESLPPCRPDTFAFFLKEATGTSLEQILNWNDWVETLGRFQSREQMETLLGRLLLISNSQNPPIEPAFVAEKLSQFPWEAFSFDYFSELDWTEVLSRIILNDHAHLLNLLAPSQLVLPNGRKATITYPLNRAPWIESRLQDFFGMRETPTVLSGKIPVTVHLLAPNYRAVQVTQDLTGFWKNHYPEIRKELSRKYPKHSWPEDPTRPLLPKTR